jgi:DNA-binding transcriptional ArsR family regulator
MVTIAMKSYAHPTLKEITLSAVMQALSDPCRIAIVRTLMNEKGSELACKATRSHHFDVLRDAGVIFTRCEGTRCMTSLRVGELNRRFPGLLKLIAADK